MYSEKIVRTILNDVQVGKLSAEKAYEKLKHLPYENLSFARLDHHRSMRKNMPEAIYAPGKTFEQLIKIVRSFKKGGQRILITRLERSVFQKLQKKIPFLSYSDGGKIAYYSPVKDEKRSKTKDAIAVLTAGTGDIPVAEEAAVTLEVMGIPVRRVYDCGVAGLHRLLDLLHQFNETKAIICIAGMDGALPSVVAGMVDKPIIAVPTSVGYGANFQGVAPLLTMLNSCAPGVAVVNIDNGYGAACFALMMIAKQGHEDSGT
jgi:pyridinium-3,5-biscarboxylic acid mononucleotide synthase